MNLNWKIAFYGLLVSFAFFFLLPIWGALMTSLKTTVEVTTSNPLIPPREVTISPWISAFGYLRGPLLNSALMTVGGVVGSVILGSICGYVFSMYRFKYDNLVFIILAIGAFIPYQSILIPLYQTIEAMGLFGKVQGLALTHAVYGIPVCALMFRSFYGIIPKNVVNQAKIDGAGPWRIYRKIVVPNTVIATVTVIIFQFVSIWNDFLFGLVLGGSTAMPATVALNNLKGTMAAQWNIQMAGSMIVALPILVLFIVLGRFLVRGYMAGAVIR